MRAWSAEQRRSARLCPCGGATKSMWRLSVPYQRFSTWQACGLSTSSAVLDFDAYINLHGPQLVPPVGNKLLFADWLKVMIVGGPNQRKDYHLQVPEYILALNLIIQSVSCLQYAVGRTACCFRQRSNLALASIISSCVLLF